MSLHFGQCEMKNESSYFEQGGASETVSGTLTIIVSLLGLALNIVSLVVFVRVFTKPNNRNHFHLFFVYLSVCEIAFCLFSAATFVAMSVSKKQRISWHSPEQNQTKIFLYSIFVPNTEPAVSRWLHYLLSLSGYMSVVSQFSRNSWVALTAMLRCYVATRRTNLQISSVFSFRRVTLLFVLQLLLVLMLGLVRSYFMNPRTFFSPNAFACNTSTWRRRGVMMLQVLISKRSAGNINLYWTLLTQALPLTVITVSSVILVHALRANSMVNSSERNKKITRMVVIFALIFALLEGPRALAFALIRIVGPDFLSITYILSVTDSIVNVLIYFFNDQHFKNEFCNSSCSSLRLRRRSASAAASASATSGPASGRDGELKMSLTAARDDQEIEHQDHGDQQQIDTKV